MKKRRKIRRKKRKSFFAGLIDAFPTNGDWERTGRIEGGQKVEGRNKSTGETYWF